MMLVRVFQGDGSLYEYSEGGMYFASYQLQAEAVTLTESWQVPGIYLFTEQPREQLGDLPTFLKEMLELFTGYAFPRLFLWVNDTNGTSLRWQTLALTCRIEDGLAFTNRACAFGEGKYRLDIPANTQITCSDAAFVMETTKGAPITMRLAKIIGKGKAVSLTADGSFQGKVTIESENNLFHCMNVAVRYMIAGNEWEKGYAESINSRIFQYTGSLTLSFGFAPLALYQQKKTWLGLASSIVFQTGFTAWNGTALQVCTTDTSRLVLGKGCRHLYKGAAGVATMPYLTPAGEYELLLGKGAAGNRLLCGTMGTEFIQLAEDRWMSFAIGPAFLHVDDKITDECTTAWVKMPIGAVYCSQPTDAPFYGKTDAAALAFVPTYMVRCEAEAPAVPMIGYGGVEQEVAVDFEQFLYRMRFRVLSQLSGNILSNPAMTVTTPQGLMAGISDDIPAGWQWIGLANLEDKVAALPGIRFDEPDTILRTSFQQADMCVLFETPEAILEHTKVGAGFGFECEGWRFGLAPEEWWKKGHNLAQTVLILKYGTRQCIREAFEEHVVVSAAIKRAYNPLGMIREEYEEFIAAVDSHSFQGALFLNIPVTVDRSHPDFIPELGVLLDSIAEEQLYAHHLLLHKSLIADLDGLVMQPTCAGGLVDYQAEKGFSYQKDGEPRPFGFCSTALCVMVRDGHIQDIRSDSEVLLNRFFGSPAAKVTGSAGNSLVVNGRLQLRDGIREYQYNLKESGGFTLTGSAVEALLIDKLTLSTGEHNTFHFGGTLSFAHIQGADLFSYGYEDGNLPEKGDGGLRFEGLELTGQGEVWKMDYAGMQLRPFDSTPRQGSFAAGFPIRPVSISRYTVSAEELGYTSITVPLQQGKLADEWYGLLFEVPLGTLGGLAPEGQLILSLMLGWSSVADGNKAPLFAGVKQWQTSLNLQGVFTIGFTSISITVEEKETGCRYNIVFNQFGLHVLGTTFPPGANKLILFADEQGRKLGWYAAYQSEEESGGRLD